MDENQQNNSNQQINQENDNKQIENLKNEILFYYLENLISIPSGFIWGSEFITIDLKNIENHHFLKYSVKKLLKRSNTTITEDEFIMILKKIQWNELENVILTIETLRKEILSPLKKIIEYSTSHSFLSILTYIGNILVLCSFEYSEISFECISYISCGNWPMKMVCSPLLHLCPMYSFSENEILCLFGQLYNLHSSSPVDYFKTSEKDRKVHRDEFINQYILRFLLPDEIQIQYQNNTKYQPILQILYVMAGYLCEKNQEHFLQRLIIQELTYFAFSNQQQQQQSQSQLLHEFQKESKEILIKLFLNYPILISPFIFSIGQQSNQFHVENLLNFLNYDEKEENSIIINIFSNYIIDFNVMNMICYLLCGFALPSLGNNKNNSLDSNEIDKIFQILLFSSSPHHPYQQQQQQQQQNSISFNQKIACKLLQIINWNLCKSSIRLFACLIIISAKEFMLPRWSCEILLSDIGKKLTQPPFDDLFIQIILDTNISSIFSTKQMEFEILQLLCSLGIFKSKLLHSDEESHKWLVDFQFYSKFEQLCLKYSNDNEFYKILKLIIHFDYLKENQMNQYQ